MFDAISDALSGTINKLTGSNQLNGSNIQDGLQEVKKALLEADVNFKVVGEFIDRVEQKLVGISKTPGLQPTHQVVGAVHEELVNLITAQRNYQASAKAIETTTSLTQTIINIRM